MKEIDATRIKLKCLEMVEGTDLEWWKTIKFHPDQNTTILLSNAPTFSGRPPEEYELARGIVEGKLVWEGDVHYDKHGKKFITCGDYTKEYLATCTLSPPKPKTMMVELLVEDVEYYADDEKELSFSEIMDLAGRRAEACRDALEKYSKNNPNHGTLSGLNCGGITGNTTFPVTKGSS